MQGQERSDDQIQLAYGILGGFGCNCYVGPEAVLFLHSFTLHCSPLLSKSPFVSWQKSYGCRHCENTQVLLIVNALTVKESFLLRKSDYSGILGLNWAAVLEKCGKLMEQANWDLLNRIVIDKICA